ncbi:MAG TPA: O-antigen ligase family protein [Candidatus Acidoferrales bacterium]|nr:O-antigen ligase family protein [Candidatus Acidoferrales bacterium]
MNSERAITASDPWAPIVMFLLLGYLCMERPFSYLGIPPWSLFVGEVVLAWFVMFGPRLGTWRWLSVAAKLPRLKNFKRLLYLLLGYGAFQIVHGIYAGYPPLTAIRDYAFDYYPIYFFLGLWVGLSRPQTLPRFFRIFAWVNGIYGTAYVLFLDRLTWTIPGVSPDITPVPVFGLPQYSCLALVGLLAFEKSLRRAWPLLVLNGFVMLGMEVRAEWLAFAVGLAVWAWRTGNFKRAAWGGAVVVLMLAIMFVSNFTLAGPELRGGAPISARDLIGRAVAPVNKGLAEDYTASFQGDVDTAVFRTLWWAAIWQSVHKNATRAIWGYGYGYPLGDLVPYLKGRFVQTPHNAFFFALAYTGWVGVFIFFLFLTELARLLLAVPDAQVRDFGIAAFASLLAYAMFTPFFETPYGAIPFYLVFGIAAASLLSRQHAPATGQPGIVHKQKCEAGTAPAVAT